MTLFLPMPANESMAARLAELSHGEVGAFELHTFPDGETGLRYLGDVTGKDLALVCSLDNPNEKFLPLAFAAAAARDLGARTVGLVAPYLCYMRQDRRFYPGEAVTSRAFAELISDRFDWLTTVDPHLHRTKSLGEIYSIPTRALHAGPALAGWIRDNVATPFLIGPDEESRQWTEAVAAACGAPFAIFQKQRLGDRDIRTIPPQFLLPKGATPIVVDDIISSGTTMVETLRLLTSMTSQVPIAMAVHGVFAEHARAAIQDTGARLITTNSVAAACGVIDLSALIAEGLREMDRPIAGKNRFLAPL
jgi:ribose-phosphate pyrophosphokinase